MNAACSGSRGIRIADLERGHDIRSLLLDAYAELLDSCYCYIIMFVIFFYLKNHSFRCDFLIIPTSVHERIGNKRAKHRFKAAPLISII